MKFSRNSNIIPLLSQYPGKSTKKTWEFLHLMFNNVPYFPIKPADARDCALYWCTYITPLRNIIFSDIRRTDVPTFKSMFIISTPEKNKTPSKKFVDYRSNKTDSEDVTRSTRSLQHILLRSSFCQKYWLSIGFRHQRGNANWNKGGYWQSIQVVRFTWRNLDNWLQRFRVQL